MDATCAATRGTRCDVCNWEYLPNARVHFKSVEIALVDGQMQYLLIRSCHNCALLGFPMTWPLINKIEEFTELLKTRSQEVKLIYRPFNYLDLPNNLLKIEASY